MQLIRAQFTEHKRHAESVVFDFESKAEASALNIESLERQIIASEIELKETRDSSELKFSTLESEKVQMLEQLSVQKHQVCPLSGPVRFKYLIFVGLQEMGLKAELTSKTQMLEDIQIRNLEAKAQNEALFSKIFEALADFNLHFQTIAKEIAVDIETYHTEQLLSQQNIVTLQKSLEISDAARSEACESAKLCTLEKDQVESQLIEAKEMLLLSEQAKVDAEFKLQELQAEMSSAECKIEALLVSLDSSEKQKNETLQELKTLTMEKEGCAIKMTELASRVEQADDFKRKAEQTIQSLSEEHERMSQRLGELTTLLDKADCEKADLEKKLDNLKLEVSSSEQKVAELLIAFEVADKTKSDAEQNLNDLRKTMDSMLQEKLALISSAEESGLASKTLIDSFLELNYRAELSPSPDMSLIEKAAACKQILSLIVDDLQKANDGESSFKNQFAELNARMAFSENDVDKLQHRIVELEGLLNSGALEKEAVSQQNIALSELKQVLEGKIVSLEIIHDELKGKQNEGVKKLELLVLEKSTLILENERLLSSQVNDFYLHQINFF